MYKAKVILDSVAPNGRRLTTMEWTYPRFVHAEFMTHRDRARNAASSRAIPFEAVLQRVEDSPVVPLHWQQEGGGMQGAGDVPEALRPLCEAIWRRAREDAARHATALRNIEETARAHLRGEDPGYDVGLDANSELCRWIMLADAPADRDRPPVKIHKTIPNRLVEPWTWITVLTTATEWANLWRLRCHPDAEVHFQKIAYMAREAYEASVPVERTLHLPLVTEVDEEELRRLVEVHYDLSNLRPRPSVDWTLQCVSTARCARVSYLTHEGRRDWRKDLELFERLVQGSGFGHWSPHEHVARAFDSLSADKSSGPFRGWEQFRKRFPQECA